jgi:hypothetical protein
MNHYNAITDALVEFGEAITPVLTRRSDGGTAPPRGRLLVPIELHGGTVASTPRAGSLTSTERV